MRQQPPRFLAILLHLHHKRIERIELRLTAQEMVEGHLDLLPVEIAGEIEEIGLELFLGRFELGAHADIGRALQFLTRRKDTPGDCIDTVFRAQVMFDG